MVPPFQQVASPHVHNGQLTGLDTHQLDFSLARSSPSGSRSTGRQRLCFCLPHPAFPLAEPRSQIFSHVSNSPCSTRKATPGTAVEPTYRAYPCVIAALSAAPATPFPRTIPLESICHEFCRFKAVPQPLDRHKDVCAALGLNRHVPAPAPADPDIDRTFDRWTLSITPEKWEYSTP
jgi:hypothetical protein